MRYGVSVVVFILAYSFTARPQPFPWPLKLSNVEVAPAPTSKPRGERVVVDAWFNSQQRQNAAGQKEYFHYKWNDQSDSGFSLFGQMFLSNDATLDTLYEAPTVDGLKAAQIYIIVSPDNAAKNPHPHYVQKHDADQLVEWVKQGGVLVLMGNDPANADIVHLNLVSDRFGIHFDDALKHHVIGDQLAPGYIPVSIGGPLFQHSHTLYMKDTCGISLKNPAESLLDDKTGVVMATAKYGKGTVFAVVDPWLYNEYTDPRKNLSGQDNYEAGREFVQWLLKQVPSNDSAYPSLARSELQQTRRSTNHCSSAHVEFEVWNASQPGARRPLAFR